MAWQRTTSIEDLCRRLRPLFGEKIDQLYFKYSLLDDKDAKGEIENALRILYQKHLSSSLLNDELLLEPPKKESVRGAYPLGTVVYGKRQLYSFGLREQDWMRHVLISGMSGSGKTTFAFQILGNFVVKNKPFLVFDWKKSFRPLLLLNKDMRLYIVGQKGPASFLCNALIPPRGVHPKEWVGVLADLMTETYSASFGAHKLLVDTIDQTFLEFGVYAGSENYPTFEHIKERLEERADRQTKKGRESEWLESAMRILHSLTFGSFGQSMCHKGEDAHSIDELFKTQTIFELASLSSTEKKFFCQFMLTSIYKFAKAGNLQTTSEFTYAILVDEAHNVFLKDHPKFITESVPDTIFREIREYGVSLITLDQHISKLSDVVAGNSATNVAFQQMLPQDIESVSRLMQLHEYKSFFSKLPVGHAIVKLVERHHEPFIMKAPLMKLKNMSVSEEDVMIRMKEFLVDNRRRKGFEKSCTDNRLAREIEKLKAISMVSGVAADDESLTAQVLQAQAVAAAQHAQARHVSAQTKDVVDKRGIRNHVQQLILDITRERLGKGEELSNIKKFLLNEGHNNSDIQHVFRFVKNKKIDTIMQRSARLQPLVLSPEQLIFLNTITQHPDKPVSHVYKLAQLTPRKGNDVRKELEERGVIRVIEKRHEKGWTKHAIITDMSVVNAHLSE